MGYLETGLLHPMVRTLTRNQFAHLTACRSYRVAVVHHHKLVFLRVDKATYGRWQLELDHLTEGMFVHATGGYSVVGDTTACLWVGQSITTFWLKERYLRTVRVSHQEVKDGKSVWSQFPQPSHPIGDGLSLTLRTSWAMESQSTASAIVSWKNDGVGHLKLTTWPILFSICTIPGNQQCG